MGITCYVSATDPAQPSTVRARYVHLDGHPLALIPQLRGIWASTTGRDTQALIATILAHDWYYLGSDVTADTRSLPHQHPVGGVGVTFDDTDPEPTAVFPLSRAVDLDASWIYVISPSDDSVTVHTGDGDPVGVHSLGQPATRRTTMPGHASHLARWRATPCRAPAGRPHRARPLDHREPK